MAQSYKQTLTNLRNYLAGIQTTLNDLGLLGNQSISTWASQISTLVGELNSQISDDDSDFSDIYDAIVVKGQSPDEEDRSTYAPAILAISTQVNLQQKTLEPNFSNGDVTVQADNGYDGLSSIVIEKDDTLVSSNIKDGVTVHGIVGNYSGSSVYQQKTVSPDFSGGDVVVTPDSGYDAMTQVTINKDADLVAGNIKNGININGVIGTFTGGTVVLNQHPTSLAYAGQQGSTSYDDILPSDGSWTTAVDLQNINVSNGLRNVFNNNTTIQNLDLSSWDFGSKDITSIQGIFNGCTNLVTILGTLNLNKCTNYSSAFANCSSLVDCPIVNFGFGATTSSLTLDLSPCGNLDAATMITNMQTNNSGKTRILKLHPTVLAGLSQTIIDLATSKNITLQ